MTQIRVLQPGDAVALEAFLLPRIETSMFLLGNMRAVGLADGDEFMQGCYVAAWDGGEIVGVVAHYWNNNLIVQAPVLLEALCAAAIEASGRRVGGLLGPAEQVQAAKDTLELPEERSSWTRLSISTALTWPTCSCPRTCVRAAWWGGAYSRVTWSR